MFGMKKRPDGALPERIDTIIGSESSFNGKLSAAGAVRIDGRFTGEILGQGDIIIGETGKVQASVEGRNILIAGSVTGNVAASGRLEIASTGLIFGDIEAAALVIDEGASIQGNCNTKTSPQRLAHLEEDEAV